MTIFGKIIKGVTNNIIPAAISLASGNIGGAAAALLKKNSAPATVGNTAETATKPNLVLGFENSSGQIAKADFINDATDIKQAKTNQTLIYVLGGLAAVFGVLTLSKRK